MTPTQAEEMYPAEWRALRRRIHEVQAATGGHIAPHRVMVNGNRLTVVCITDFDMMTGEDGPGVLVMQQRVRHLRVVA
ncbi:MAG: hypothetical protein ACXIUZ_01605 [Lysobacteraceae bacterium]